MPQTVLQETCVLQLKNLTDCLSSYLNKNKIKRNCSLRCLPFQRNIQISNFGGLSKNYIFCKMKMSIFFKIISPNSIKHTKKNVHRSFLNSSKISKTREYTHRRSMKPPSPCPDTKTRQRQHQKRKL